VGASDQKRDIDRLAADVILESWFEARRGKHATT
jgi:RNase H-fold protein (predicted Holliday junction resolvase)